MSEHITLSAEETWNTRLKAELDKRNLSQRTFADKYNDKYGFEELPDGNKKKRKTFQADVSRWTHVGDIDSKTGKKRGFPDYKTMRNIADLLDVSVSYLTGETDYETFNLEKASKYVGLSQASIKSIKNMTKPIKIPIKNINEEPDFILHQDSHRKEALELLLTSKVFGDYLNSFYDWVNTFKHKRSNKNYLQHVFERLPKEHRDDALGIFIAREKSEEEPNINETNDLNDCVDLLELASEMDTDNDYSFDLKVEVAEYALVRTHSTVIEEIKKSIIHKATKGNK